MSNGSEGQGQGDPGGGTGGQSGGYGESGTVSFLYEVYADRAMTNLITSSGYDYASREAARDAAITWTKAQIWYAEVTTVLYVVVKPDKTGFNTSSYEIQPPYLEKDESGGPDVREGGLWWEGKVYYPGDEGYDTAKAGHDANAPGAFGDYAKDGKLYWYGWIIGLNPEGVPTKYKTERPTFETLATEYALVGQNGYFDMTRGGTWIKVYAKTDGAGGVQGDGNGALLVVAIGVLVASIGALVYVVSRHVEVSK